MATTRKTRTVFSKLGRIPGSRKIIFTASGHHALTGGSLVLIDPQRVADGDEPLTRLTPEVAFPEAEGWPQTYFADPYPLSETHYLVAWSDAPLPPGTPHPAWGMPGPPNDLGCYLFDAFGNLTLIYRDPAISCMDPLPIRLRRRPPRSRRVVNIAQEIDIHPGLGRRRLSRTGIHRAARSSNCGWSGSQPRLIRQMNYPQMGLTRDDPGKFVIGNGSGRGRWLGIFPRSFRSGVLSAGD